MSDKLAEDFDIYYLELKNFTEGFKTGSQKIETDKMLSRSGKNEKTEQLRTEHLKKVNNLNERFNSDFGKRLQSLDDRLSGKKTDAVLDVIKKKFSNGESISSDESNRLLLNEMKETKTIMRKSSFQNMLSTADIEQLRKTAQTLADNKDIERMEWLQELASLEGEEILSNTIQAQINSVKDSQMSDEQRDFQKLSERIQKGMKLFQYSLERSKTGVYVDARQDEIQ